MIITRKIKTAARVLSENGIHEVFGLVKDNVTWFCTCAKEKIKRYFTHFRMKAGLLFHGGRHGKDKMHILYVTSEFEARHSQTVRYRIHNFRQAVEGAAHTAFEVVDDCAEYADTLMRWADVIVLMRVTWVPAAGVIIEKAKKAGIPVVFDIDDLIFLPSFAVDYCEVLGETGEKNVKKRAKEFGGFEKTFNKCPYATASTYFITEQMKKAGKKSFVIHNALNARQIKIALNAKKRTDGPRAIGYLSGTNTHDRDFKLVLPAIEKIMKEYKDVILNVAGYLDLDMLPETVRKRTRHAPYMSWARLMAYGAGNYINIAPLDTENAFCNAKSELKYFEAGAAGVPTVASATDTYSRCIKSGVNGILAKTPEDWYNALKRLLSDREYHDIIAKNAAESSMKYYSPEANAGEALKAYGAIVSDFRKR